MRYDFRPAMPDVTAFPRAAWLRSVREAMRSITDYDLGYGDPRGIESLRSGLAGYFGRVRGVVADPARIVITSGYSQGLNVVCHALRGREADRDRGPEQPAPARDRRPRRPRGREGARRRRRHRGRRAPARRRRRRHARPPAPDRRAALTRAARRADRLAARQRRDRDRGRLRRRVPLRPPGGRGAPGTRSRARDLRRIGEQDAGARAAARVARGAERPRRPRERREDARRPRDVADRPARVRRLPRPRGARPPPPPHADAVPRAA